MGGSKGKQDMNAIVQEGEGEGGGGEGRTVVSFERGGCRFGTLPLETAKVLATHCQKEQED